MNYAANVPEETKTHSEAVLNAFQDTHQRFFNW